MLAHIQHIIKRAPLLFSAALNRVLELMLAMQIMRPFGAWLLIPHRSPEDTYLEDFSHQQIAIQ